MAQNNKTKEENEALFSPTHKSPERRAGSAIAAAMTLPTLLGIVNARTQWIHSGAWQSFRENFGNSFKNLFEAAKYEPTMTTVSGSKSIRAQVSELEKQILRDIEQKGGSSQTASPVPHFLNDSIEEAKDGPTFNIESKIPHIFGKEKLEMKARNAGEIFADYLGKNLPAIGSGNNYISPTTNDLTSVIRMQLDNVAQGLDISDQQLNALHEADRKMQQKHRAIFEASGQTKLHDQLYSNGAYADELSKGLKRYDDHINILKKELAELEAIISTSGPAKRQVAEAHLNALAKSSGMTRAEYHTYISNLNVKLNIKSVLRGDVSFKNVEIILSSKGKIRQPIKQSFNIGKMGMIAPSVHTSIHNDAIHMPLGSTSAKDAVTNTLGQLRATFSRIDKQFNDLMDDSFYSGQFTKGVARTLKPYRELIGPRTNNVQDIVRGGKIISDEMRALSGELPDSFYKNISRGKGSYFLDADLRGTENNTVTFDFEFNAPKSSVKGSQMLIQDAKTSVYWMNYVTQKGGNKEKIFNHFIRPDNWASVGDAKGIEDSVEAFMLKHQKGNRNKNYEMFKELTAMFKDSAKQLEKTGTRYVTINTKHFGGEVTIWNKWASTLKFAQDVYSGTDAAPVWQGHNIRTADLPLLHKMASDALQSGELGGPGSRNFKLVERLAKETSEEALNASGRFVDTYSWASFITSNNRVDQSLQLENIFDSLMHEAVAEQSPTKVFNKDAWKKELVNAVKNQDKKQLNNILHNLPTDIRVGMDNWIKHSPADVISVFSSASHHHPGFDVRSAIILKDLLYWKTQKLRLEDPETFKAMMGVGHVADDIITGRKRSWHHAIDAAEQSTLFDVPDHGIGEQDASRIYSRLFGLTPASASRAMGAIFSPENYLPFGQYANIQKQMYQALSDKALMPGLAHREYKAAKGQMPIVQNAIDSNGTTNMWANSIGRAIQQDFEEQQARFAKLGPLRSRFHAMTMYLPSYNSLVGQDTGLWANNAARGLAKHLPRGGDGLRKVVSVERASQLINNKTGTTSNMSVARWLAESGVNQDIVDLVAADSKYKGLSLKELMDGQADDLGNTNKFTIDLDSERTPEGRKRLLLHGSNNHILEPDTPLINERVSKKKVKPSQYDHRNPLKYKSIVRSLTFDLQTDEFIFNLLPFEEPGMAKIVDSTKFFKGNVIGVANGMKVGTGIGLIVGAKKPNLMNFFEVHMRRTLDNLHSQNKSVWGQKRFLKKMLMETFGVSAEEFDNTFNFKEMPLANVGQEKKFSNALVTVELADNYIIKGLDHQKLTSSVFEMLKRSGITHDKLKERFIRMNYDLLQEAGYRGNKEAHLSKVYDFAVKRQEKAINELAKNIDVSTNEGRLINQMQKIMKETNIALYDPAIVLEEHKLNVSEIQTKGLLHGDEITRGVYFEATAHIFRGEWGVMEDFKDVRGPSTRPVDAYGTPTHKTFSIWQAMTVYNANRENSYFRDSFLKRLIADSGHFDKGIQRKLQANVAAASYLQGGLNFDLSKYDVYNFTLSDMKSDIAALSTLEAESRGIKFAGQTQERIEQYLKAQGTLSDREAELLAAEIYDNEAVVKRIRQSGTIIPDRNKIKVFSDDILKHDLLKLEMPDLEEMFKGWDSNKKAAVKEIINKQRSTLIGQIKKQLRKRATSAAELQRLELELKRLTGAATDGRLKDLVIATDGPIKLGSNKYQLAGRSATIAEMMQSIDNFNTNAIALAENTNGLTESQLRAKLGTEFDDVSAKLGSRLISLVYQGIAIGEHKAGQFYGRGLQYAKAVDGMVLAKNSLGAILGKDADTIKKAIGGTITSDDSLLSVLEDLKAKAKGRSVGILDRIIEKHKKITYKDIITGLTGDSNVSTASMLTKDGYFKAKGAGLGEVIVSSSHLGEMLLAQDSDKIIKALTSKGRAGSVDQWFNMVTGRSRLVETIGRNPLFENTLGVMNSATYVYHDMLFKGMGVKNELSNIVGMHGIELMLMRGDYDGDIVARMLNKLNVSGDPGAAEGIRKEIRRVQEKMFFQGVAAGKDSLKYGGRSGADIFKNERIVEDADGLPRLLLKEEGDQDLSTIVRGLTKDLVDGIAQDNSQSTMKKQGLTYMVQQLLTGPVGEQQKVFDMLYLGKDPSMKTDVVDPLVKMLEEARTPEERRTHLMALGIDAAEMADSDLAYQSNKIKREVEDAWKVLNKRADLNLGTLGQTTYKNRDILHEYMKLFTHEIPIEKDKGFGAMSELMSTMQAKHKFHAGTLSRSTSQDLSMTMYNRLGVTAGQADSMFGSLEKLEEMGLKPAEAREFIEKGRNAFLLASEKAQYLNFVSNRMQSQGYMYGNSSYFLASKKPRDLMYGVLSDSLGGSRKWIGNEISNMLSAGTMGASNLDDMAAVGADILMNETIYKKRAAVEGLGSFFKKVVTEAAHGKWTKRAAIGVAALAIMDPNTNSILLPQQQADGEKNDIPSLSEITRGYRRHEVKAQTMTAALVDKMTAAAGLPVSIGTAGVRNNYLPPMPQGQTRYHKRERRQNALTLNEYARQVKGVLLR